MRIIQMEFAEAEERLRRKFPDLPTGWGIKDLMVQMGKLAPPLSQGGLWFPQLNIGISLPNIPSSAYLLVAFGDHLGGAWIRGDGGDSVDDLKELVAIAAVQAIDGDALVEVA